MTTQFQRAFKLNIGGRLIQGLDIEFRIDRSLKATQNTADLTVINLSPETRKFLQSQTKGVVAEFRAGYLPSTVKEPAAADLPLIFFGELREVTSVRDKTDWLTQISTGDADKLKKRPVAFSFGPGALIEHVLKRIVSDMGANPGNLDSAISDATFDNGGQQFAEGVTSYGTGDEELGKHLQSVDMEHSWQNGALQVLPRGGHLDSTAVLLTEETGLIGSPELGDKGSCKFRSLLNHEIAPGRVVHIKSVNVDAFFVVQRAVYSGQSAGNDWFVDGDGKPRV